MKKLFSAEEVIAHVEAKKEANKPRMVYEVDYKKLQDTANKATKRNEACIDALLLQMANLREALKYSQFENRQLKGSNKKLKEKNEALKNADKSGEEETKE